MHRRSLIVTLAATAFAGSAQAAGKPRPEAVVDAFHAALKAGDAAAAADLMAEDAVIFEQGGAETSRAEYVSGHLPGDIAYSATTTDETTSRRSQVTGSLAVIMSEGRTTGRYDGKPVNRRSTETMVLKKTRAGWRILHVHWSSRAG